MTGDPRQSRRSDAAAPLAVGDPLTPAPWRDHLGRPFSLREDPYIGHTTVLLLAPLPNAPGVREALQALARAFEAWGELGVQVFVVTAGGVQANAALHRRLSLPFAIAHDDGFAIGKGLGWPNIAKQAAGGGLPLGLAGPPWRGLVVGRRGYILAIEAPSGPAEEAADAFQARALSLAKADRELFEIGHPPVLVAPRILDPDHCERLIAFWEEGDRYRGGVASEGHRHAVKQSVKQREDVALPDLGPEAQEVFGLFRRRLFPEIRKVFQFKVTRAETLRLGCYDAVEKGGFKAHRDDTVPAVAHRRFAISVFLNSGEYQGGGVRFPEFGPQTFDPPAGSAAIFSCSLLHEVQPVTQGRRFVLLGFFHGENEEAQRRRRIPAAQYRDYSRVDS